MSEQTQLATRSTNFMPAMSIPDAINRRNVFTEFVKNVMVDGIDYGKVPGVDKPSLLKPGAEKLTTLFGLTARPTIIQKIEDWTGHDHNGEPLFYYLYRYSLYRGDMLIAEADGSCNSRESKYRWRWVKEQDLPRNIDKDSLMRRDSTVREPLFAIEKAETAGKYGKPAAYWQRFKDAIVSGEAKKTTVKFGQGKEFPGYEIPTVVYRVPNDDVFGQVNTVLKMAEKRALIAVTLLATNASEVFTQDVEDMDMIDIPAHHIKDAEPKKDAPTADAPAKDPLEDNKQFLAVMGAACISRGATRESAWEWWKKGLEDNSATVDNFTLDDRQRLIAEIKSGKFDQFIKPPPAQQVPTARDQFVAIAGELQIEAESANAAFDKWLLRSGFKANEAKIPPAKRDALLAALRADQFDYAKGLILEAAVVG